jgi:hypothetical protein
MLSQEHRLAVKIDTAKQAAYLSYLSSTANWRNPYCYSHIWSMASFRTILSAARSMGWLAHIGLGLCGITSFSKFSGTLLRKE